MNVPDAAAELVKDAEGLRLETYLCPRGVPTIGYGHTAKAGPPRPTAGMRISPAEAEEILQRDLTDVATRLRPLINVAITDNQFGALVSFAFNFGVGAFEGSTLRTLINGGVLGAVPAELAKWRHATVKGRKVVLPGLVKRRAAEVELWSST